MTTTQLQFINKHIEQNDLDIAFRKLIDFVRDTEDMPSFQKIIDLTDWKESTHLSEIELKNRLSQLLQELNDFDYVAPAAERKLIVKITDIRKTYRRNNFSLGPINLTLEKGEIIGLVGENGNGKTTLLTILAQELSFEKGNLEYFFDEQPKGTFELRTKLAYIPQRPNKWYGSLQDNLKFVLSNYKIPPKEIDLRVLVIIARLGLWRYKDLNWNELSSGYKMRFELARTLLRKPEILLLDEPLANLDIMAQQIILEDLKLISTSAKNPIALILSSQQLYEIEKISDKVIFLQEGKMHNTEEKQREDEQVVIELDTKESKERLENIFRDLGLENISFNGGVFVLYFKKNTSQSDILLRLATNKITILNFRDISHSSRRYFDS
ncbi:MAG: ATP-binding cassette domain-containing protein [Saprospiraceae bacterium]